MIFSRSPQIASRVFGTDAPGQLFRAIPRVRFMYFVEFMLSDAGAAITSNANYNTYKGNRGISFKVRQIDKPRVSLVVNELNQYNKKKLTYSKIDYGDVTMRIYDAVDDSVLGMWVDYFTFYFGDSRRKNVQSYQQSPIDPQFLDDTGWGFRPLSDNTRFFDKITVYAFYANTYTAFSYINPKITSVDWQTKEYSSSDPEEVNMSFKYEALEYLEFAQPYDPTLFGWLPIDALKLNESIPALPKATSPRIFTTQMGIPPSTTPLSGTADIPTTVAPATSSQITMENLPPIPGSTTTFTSIDGELVTIPSGEADPNYNAIPARPIGTIGSITFGD